MLIADDHRFDALGAAGNPAVRTPALDALADRGVRMGQAHCQGGMSGAICAPSRACLMTGSELFHATASSVLGDQGVNRIAEDRATMPATLRANGYHTHAVGKWHNGTQSFAAGFDSGARLFFGGMSDPWAVPLHDFDASGRYPAESARYGEGFSTELFADSAIDFLSTYDRPEPFFCYVAFTAPHDPRTPPPPYDTMYDPESIAVPPNFAAEPGFDHGCRSERDERLTWVPRSARTVQNHIADYYGMISHLDSQVGRILSALEESGHGEDTVVVYLADHGLAVGQHGLLGKQNMYDHSARIPMLLAGPGLPVGQRIEALCTLADLFPTMCDLTGTPVPGTVEGHNLLPLFEGGEDRVRSHTFGAYRDVQRMVSDGAHKLIRYRRTQDGRGSDRIQLFDLRTDPWETTDLSSDPGSGAVADRLGAALETWQRAVGDPYRW